MSHPLDFHHDGLFLIVYASALTLLIGVLIFAVNVKKMARKRNIY